MNPVLRKDLLALLRLKRVAAIQLLFIGVLSILLLATWPQGGVLTLESGRQDNLLLGLIVGQLVLLVLFVPGIAAVSLTGEKEANTLEMLYASRLSPGQIIGGKVSSAISFPLLLLVSGLPFVALLYWRGEVDLQKLGWSYAVLVVAAILAIVSLMVSAICKQSATSLVLSYATVLTLCGGVLVPAALMLESQAGVGAQVLHYARGLSPVAAALSLLRPGLNDFSGENHRFLSSHSVFLICASLVSLGCFAIVAIRLSRPPTSPDAFGAPLGGTDEERSIGRRIMFLIDPKKRRKPFGSINPLITKERRTNNLRSGRWMIRIFYGCLFLSLALAVMSLYGGTEHPDLLRYVAQVLVAFQLGVIALVDPSLTTSAISSEIENGTFEMLRLTRLRAGQIFWGKFVPAFLPALLPIVALLPAYATVCVVDTGYIQTLLRLLPVVLLAVVFCCTLGLCCSTILSNTARATVAAYVITAALFVLPLFGWWGAGLIPMRIAPWLAMPSPLAMALSLLPPDQSIPNPTPAQQLPEHVARLLPEHLWWMVGLCVLLLIVSRLRLRALLKQG